MKLNRVLSISVCAVLGLSASGCGIAHETTSQAPASSRASSLAPITPVPSLPSSVRGTPEAPLPVGSTEGASAGPTSSPTCQPQALAGRIVFEGASAGIDHNLIVFTNTGATTCSVSGYPEVEFYSADDQRLTVPVRHVSASSKITLHPRASSSALLESFTRQCSAYITSQSETIAFQGTHLKSAVPVRLCLPTLTAVTAGDYFPGTDSSAP